MDPLHLFEGSRNTESLYNAVFSLLGSTTTKTKTVLEVGSDTAFEPALLVPEPFMHALKSICRQSGWCLEGALQGCPDGV